jgi:hypothetical protein
VFLAAFRRAPLKNHKVFRIDHWGIDMVVDPQGIPVNVFHSPQDGPLAG